MPKMDHSVRKTPIKRDSLFNKVVSILEKELTDDEFQDFVELMDADCNDDLLEKVNSRLFELHPELFMDANADNE